MAGYSGTDLPLLLRLVGSFWRAARSAGSRGTDLESVACAVASDCWAVGTTAGAPFAERFDGSTWLAATTPTISAKSAVLSGVPCPSAACTAIGGAGSGTVQSGLVETVSKDPG